MNYFKYIFFSFIVLFSVELNAQDIENDSVANRYHFNQDYNYYADSSIVLEYHSDSLLKHAAKHIGTTYVPNGKLPGGFDCSGFTFYNFKRFGIYLPYYSFQQAEIGQLIANSEAQKGDLIIFKGHDLTSEKAGHVGIVAENKSGRIRFIHASTSHGVKYDFVDAPYFKERFMGVRRIL